jgi:hypothetical protein
VTATLTDELPAEVELQQSRYTCHVRVLAEQLDAMGALRVPVDEATDILCALCGLGMYLVLADRGWTAEQWERFVVDALTHALLKPASSPGSRRATARTE